MHPPKSMSRVVNGARYNVATATLIASNEYWDGHNFERSGTNTFLYKTRGGAYFRVDLTQWQGQRDTLEPVTREEAIELYEQHLPEHIVTYEAAFDAIVEEASAGRPTYYSEAMKQTAIWLPEPMLTWLKDQPGSMSETIRTMIETAIRNQANDQLHAMASGALGNWLLETYTDQAEGLAVQAGLQILINSTFDADVIAARIKNPDDWDGLSEWSQYLGSN